MPKTRFFVAVIALALIGSTPSRAQSSAQMIDGLKPKVLDLSGPSRGIRPTTSTAPAADAAAPDRGGSHASAHPARQLASAGVVGTHAAADKPSLDLQVQFKSGSAELTPAAVDLLNRLGQALSSRELTSYRFRIEGHTDTAGAPESNMTLSQRRAQAVVDYMTSKFSVDPSRLEAVGLGSTKLAVQTGDQVAEARNRRVHIVNLGA